jgi:hypothetical protein
MIYLCKNLFSNNPLLIIHYAERDAHLSPAPLSMIVRGARTVPL